jgi:UDP-2,3-diacylglucosamine pyrophosphatase LpxH
MLDIVVSKDRTSARLSEVFQAARGDTLKFDDGSKIVLFSDCHRGDNSWGDDFAPNQLLFFHALRYYLQQGYTYIEVGDGDELWENASFEEIRKAHDHVFWLLSEFHRASRLHMLFGNHDLERRDPDVVRRQLDDYYDEREKKRVDLLPGISLKEAIVLEYEPSGHQLLVVHGHQGDLLNDRLWRLSRFGVRFLWSRLQAFGVKDPTRPSEHPSWRSTIEARIKEWIRANGGIPVICGHTHRPEYPDDRRVPYFNSGSCVHPRCITGIELSGGTISLVKWWTTVDDGLADGGRLVVKREYLRGPEPLRGFFRAVGPDGG